MIASSTATIFTFSLIGFSFVYYAMYIMLIFVILYTIFWAITLFYKSIMMLIP